MRALQQRVAAATTPTPVARPRRAAAAGRTNANSTSPGLAPAPAPLRHPPGLMVLFFTEMWERFGFYLMTALFTLFMTESQHWSEGRASEAFGSYNGLVYLSPFFGGIFADRIFGYRRSVMAGAATLALGYFVFALGTHGSYYAAIAVLTLGNGLFKPNISTLVGKLYPEGDPRRDSAFSIFYMGINIGGGLAPIIGGLVRQRFGWGPAFATAGLGMLVSLLSFVAFGHHVRLAEQPQPGGAAEGATAAERRDPPEVERLRIVALLIFCGIVMLFWLAFNQNGTALTFWARDNTDRLLRLGTWAWELKPEYFAAVNSIFIIALTPPLVWLMGRLRRRGLEPSTTAKIGLGMLFTALSYAVMVAASWAGGNTGKVSMLWLIGCYFLITIGELFVSPLGLSMVAKLAPVRMTSMLMGCWFISTAIGTKLAGQLGLLWNSWQHSRFFALLVATSLAAGAILVWQSRRLRAALSVGTGAQDGRPQAELAAAAPKRADIVEVIGQHVVLRQVGADFAGNCPFHPDQDGQLCVSRKKQFFFCFGCQRSGDLQRFVNDLEQLKLGDSPPLALGVPADAMTAVEKVDGIGSEHSKE